MSLSLVKEEPEESTCVEYCSTTANDSSLALDSLLFLTNKREDEELPGCGHAALTTRDCEVESFLTSEGSFDRREEKARVSGSCSVPSLASAGNHNSADQSEAWTAESRFPRTAAVLPSSPYSEEEVRLLLQAGQYRLVKLHSKSQVWQYFERVFNELGQDTTYVLCLSCRNLLRHKLASSTAPLVAHVLLCTGHRLACDSPESPGSRSSESVSPQLAREELPQQSQLLFSPPLLSTDHLAFRQQYLWKSQNTFLQRSSPALPPLSPLEAHNSSRHLHSNLPAFAAGLQTSSSSLSPRLPLSRHDASGIVSPSLPSRRTRRSRCRDGSRHQQPSDNSDINCTSPKARLGDTSPQKTSGNSSHISLAQKAVLDAAVGFCCLDGRWFDDIAGQGMRELAQAFVNIGAQFGTLPAETLLPSASAIRSRAAEMAGLKRGHVATSLCKTIKNNGGCLAIATVEHQDGRQWLRCSLHCLSGKLRGGVVLGEWPQTDHSALQCRLRDALERLGLLPLKDELIITADISFLRDQHRTHSDVSVQNTLQTSGSDSSFGPSPPEPPMGGQDLQMTKEVPCGVGMIHNAICRILEHPRLCALYRTTLLSNSHLLKALNTMSSSELASCLLKTLRLKEGSLSLAKVKFTLNSKKEIEDLLTRSPECILQYESTCEKSFRKNPSREKCETNVDCDFLNSALKDKRSENPAVKGSCLSSIPQFLEPVLKDLGGNSSKIVIDDAVLIQITDYFEPFDAALADIRNSNENGPNLGKLLPWIKTLRQYAADAVESTGQNKGNSGSGDVSDGTPCECCLRESQIQPVKNRSSNGDSGVSGTKYTSGDEKSTVFDVFTNTSSLQSRCMSIQEVGCEVITNLLVPHPVHYVATFLTPHFKSLAMLDEHERLKTLKWVKQLAGEHRSIGTQFWSGACDGASNSLECGAKACADDGIPQLSCSPRADINDTQSVDEHASLNISRFNISNSSLEKCGERSKRHKGSDCTKVNDRPPENEKLGGSHKNPTLKSLLEDDSSKLYQSNRGTLRGRGHPTLVSLLESSSSGTHSSVAENHPSKRSFDESVGSKTSLQDCDRPSKTQKSTHLLEKDDESTVAKSCTEISQEKTIDNTSSQSCGLERLENKNESCGVAGESGAPKTSVWDKGGNPRGQAAKRRFTSIAHFMQSNTGDADAEDSPVDIELSRYQSLPFPPSSASCDDWWLQKSSHLPALAGVARRVLAVPGAVLSGGRGQACAGVPPSTRCGADTLRARLGSETTASFGPSEDDVESLNNLMFLAAEW